MKPKICRLCLATDDSDLEFRSVFEENIAKKIKLCTGVIVRTDDVCSTNICSACCSILYYFNKFKNKCFKNNRILKKMAKVDSKSFNEEEVVLDNEVGEVTEEEQDVQNELTSSEIKEKLLDNNGVLICPLCLKTGYLNKASLMSHIYRLHSEKVNEMYEGSTLKLDISDKQNRLCKYCPNKKFTSSTKLNEHIKEAHYKKVYRCRVCKRSFSRYKLCYNHISLAHAIKKANRHDYILISTVFKNRYICTICDEKFLDWSRLKQHRKQFHFKRTHSCPICGHGAATTFDIVQHIQDVHKKTKTDGEDTQEIEMIVVKEELIIPDVQEHIPDQLVEIKKEPLLEEEVEQVFEEVKQEPFEGEVSQMLVDFEDEFTIQSLEDHQQPSSSNSLDIHKEMEECTLSKEEINAFIVQHSQKLQEFADNVMKMGTTRPSLQQRAVKINQQQKLYFNCTFCHTKSTMKNFIYHLVKCHFQRVSLMLNSNSVYPQEPEICCKICNKKFKTFSVLQRHMKVHSLI